MTGNSGGAIEDEIVVRRVGSEIVVSELFGPRIDCHGSPTVTNTDEIKLRARGFSEMSIRLAGGPFAPGATPEADGSPEIEISALSQFGTFYLEGAPGADHFRYLSAAGKSGLNLNAGPGDEDIDFFVAAAETELFVEGRRGADTIEVVPPVDVEVAAFGGAGNDTLVGQRAGIFGGVLLEGGAGRDRITGSPASDLIIPGTGADVVKAEGGSDEIKMGPDRRRDRIDCGPGRDEVRRWYGDGAPRDPFDRLRARERVRHARR